MVELKEVAIPQVVSISKAAEITQLPKSYIRELAKSGKICFIKTGVKYLINMQSLADYLNGKGDKQKKTNENALLKQLEQLPLKSEHVGKQLGEEPKTGSEQKEKRNEEYPLNLIHAIISVGNDVTLPDDYRGSLEYILAEKLTEREARVIYARYRDKKTFNVIASEHKLSMERIRQIEGKAIRKLRSPTRLRYLIKGIKAIEQEMVQNAVSDVLQDAVNNLSNLSATIAKLMDRPEIKRNLEETNRRDETTVLIEELNLSTRSYNALKRANLLTLDDIVNCSEKELMRCRNMGAKSFEEIKRAICALGYNLKEEGSDTDG